MNAQNALKVVGGWIKSAEASIDRTYRQMRKAGEVLDPARIAYFEDYRMIELMNCCPPKKKKKS